MKNIYNKGKYNCEYGKIPKWLQKFGNRRWRSDQCKVVKEQLLLNRTTNSESINCTKTIKKKSTKNKIIRVKITYKGHNNTTFSNYKKFASERDLNNSIKRNSVIKVFLNSKQIK